jgi:cytochrome c
MRRLVMLLVVTLFALGLVQRVCADDAVKAEALVKKGVALYKSHEDNALELFSDPKGGFVEGELYLFVVDFSGLTTAHGGNPGLIGKNMRELKDADGKFFIQAMIDVAKSKGSGWVEYKWKNPKTGAVLPKLSYVEKVGDSAFIGCGIYKK